MHLFFIDQYITLDMFSPIIYKLSKKKEKIFIYNCNYVQNYNNEKKFKFILDKKNVINIKVSKFFNIISLFDFLLIYFAAKLPEKIVRKLFNFWRKAYAGKILISENKILDFIKNNNITTISIDESLPEVKRDFIINLKKKCKIKIIVIHGGLHTLVTKQNINNFISKIDYYLSPGKIPTYTYGFNKSFINSSKYVEIGSPRFSPEWIKILDKISKTKVKKNNDGKKIRIGLFVRANNISNKKVESLLNKLNKLNFVEIKLNQKPRDSLPGKNSIIFKSELNSTELINWSDIIITYPTSINIEAIIKNKYTILTNYIKVHIENQNSWFSKFKIIENVKTEKQVFELINRYRLNKKSKLKVKDKYKLLKLFISYKKGESILERYKNFYENIKI
jgi:hypothetical protein